MSPLKLFHVSEEPHIKVFDPRPPPSPEAGVTGNAVWTIDEAHLPNYLLPRDCPRVTFAKSKQTSQDDHDRFLLGASASRVVAVESGWLPKIEACQLYLYEFSSEEFEVVDAAAGYYISRNSVTATKVTKIENLIHELLKRNIEVRILPNLWNLRNAIAASTLEFSIIRFRNSLPQN